MEITGRHVLIGFVAAFGIIIGVNIILAVSAVKTFPGLETDSPYIANQTFDIEREAQEALGWDVTASVTDGVLTVAILGDDGQPVQVADLENMTALPIAISVQERGHGTAIHPDFTSAYITQQDRSRLYKLSFTDPMNPDQ